MADLKQCEFFLLRYVPDAVKDEFVNVGLLMFGGPANGSQERFAAVRFTRDWSRVRCIDPAADIEMLEAFEASIRAELEAGTGGRDVVLKRLEDSFSNLVQLSSGKACLTESPQQEAEVLAKLYLESAPRKGVRERSASARARIVAQMREAFDAVGVWPLMWKKIPAAEYTQLGDPLKIDCGYKPNGVVKLFHALALDGEIDSAKILAFSYPAIKAGIAEKLKAGAELTAVVNEQSTDAADEQVGFALQTLRVSEIQVARVEDLAGLAETARREMRL
jgi:hypothetical protein